MPSNLQSKIAAEFLGTFTFVLVGAGAAIGAVASGANDPGIRLVIAALANGLGLAVFVSVTMPVSGGVLNPAVALSLLVARKLHVKEFVFYVVAELLGAVTAVLALMAAIPSLLGASAGWGAPALSSALSVEQGVAAEALMTFVLVIAVFGTAVDGRAPKIAGFGIGLAVLADVLMGGSLTGAAMNPARALGPMIASLSVPSYWYIYVVGPVVGALAASIAYRFALGEEPRTG